MWSISLIVAALFLAIGYQLRYKKRYALIAGYHPLRTENPEAIARMLGGVSLASGVCFGLVGLSSRLVPTAAPWGAIFSAIPVGTLIAIAIGSLKIGRRPKHQTNMR
jgi:Domain of unknown function (DUF3784)